MLSWQRSLVVKVFATKSKGPKFEPCAGLTGWFFFLFSLLISFLHVYFNVLSVLRVPTSRNKDILSRFPIINYRILTHMGSKDRFNFAANFVSDVCEIADILPYSLSRSHAAVLGILIIVYPMPLSLHRWGRHLSDVVATADTNRPVGDIPRPQAMPLAMLTMKIETLGFHNFYALFSSVSPIYISIRLRSPALRTREAPLITIVFKHGKLHICLLWVCEYLNITSHCWRIKFSGKIDGTLKVLVAQGKLPLKIHKKNLTRRSGITTFSLPLYDRASML